MCEEMFPNDKPDLHVYTSVLLYTVLWRSKLNELHLPTLCDDDRELGLVVGSNWDILVGQRNTHSRTDVKTTQLHY